MQIIQCFFLTDTKTVRRSLRRYTYSSIKPCPERQFGHNANSGVIDVVALDGSSIDWPLDDPRWPAACSCGYAFTEEDPRQLCTAILYERHDTFEVIALHEAPAGAMWFAPWLDTIHVPQLQHSLVVQTPGGTWDVDAQCRNCTMHDDHRQERHHCWVLHGEPPTVTVDKNGATCGAGGGSIVCGSYHGFLRNGRLESC